MHLRAPVGVAFAAIGAAALFLMAGTALAGLPGEGDWPASNYARAASPNDCTAAIQAPVGLAFVGFADTTQAQSTIALKTGWPLASPGAWRLRMTNGPEEGASTQCLGEANGRVSTTNPSDTEHTYLRLWNNPNSGVVAGTLEQQEKKTRPGCGTNPKWITTEDGYALGREEFELAFGGSLSPNGPYPFEGVMWGNSASIQQCDGTVSSSNGWVDIVRPKDEFGFQDGFRKGRDTLFRTGPESSQQHTVGSCTETLPQTVAPLKQSFINQLQASGATTIRFGISWDQVAPCSASTPTQWYWERWDETIPQLAADPDGAGPEKGIQSIIDISGAPSNHSGQPQWSEPGCNGVVNTDSSQGGLTNWRKFVEQVAERYAGQIKAIEVWNEENMSAHWGGCPVNSEHYATILDRAILGIDDAREQVPPGTPVPQLVVGGPFSRPNADEGDEGVVSYMTGVFNHLTEADEAKLAGVGLHPYRTGGDKTLGKSPAESASDQVDRLEAALHGLGVDLPVWVTEVGTTITDLDNPINVDNLNDPDPETAAGAPWTQGLADLELYQTLRNSGVPATIIYSYVNSDLDAASMSSGVLIKPTTPPPGPLPTKPAYCLLAAERGSVPPNPCPSG